MTNYEDHTLAVVAARDNSAALEILCTAADEASDTAWADYGVALLTEDPALICRALDAAHDATSAASAAKSRADVAWVRLDRLLGF